MRVVRVEPQVWITTTPLDRALMPHPRTGRLTHRPTPDDKIAGFVIFAGAQHISRKTRLAPCLVGKWAKGAIPLPYTHARGVCRAAGAECLALFDAEYSVALRRDPPP